MMVSSAHANSLADRSGMSCELITDFSRLEALAPEWDRWARETRSATIFQQWEWIRAFWKVYGRDLSLYSLAIHQGHRTRGILPIVQREGHLEFLASLESDYNDLLCDDGYATQVLQTAVEFLLKSPLEWTSAVLDYIPAQSRIVRSIPYLPQHVRRHLQLVFRCFSPAVVADRDKRGVLNRLMDKEQLRRYDKKLQKQGRLAYRHFETRQDAREHLERFFHQHITRCAMNGLRSQFLSADRRAFCAALIDEFDPATQLRFGALELDSRAIAYHLGFQINGKLTWYKPAFDINYWEYCPGNVLLRNLLAYVRDSDLHELDFTIGDEPFKLRFANQIRRNYALHLERYPERLETRIRTVVRATRHIVRQNPGWKATLKAGADRLAVGAATLRNFVIGEGFWNNWHDHLRAVARFIWSDDEVLFFAPSVDVEIEPGLITVTSGTLDDLASLSAQSGHFLSPSRLHEYRRRLKAGDRCLVARNARGEAAVLWLQWRTEIDVNGIPGECKLPLATPAWVVDEYWTAPRVSARLVSPDVLRAAARHLGRSGFWIYEVRGRGCLSEAAGEAGLELRYRVACRSFLGSFSRIRILSSARSCGRQRQDLQVRAGPVVSRPGAPCGQRTIETSTGAFPKSCGTGAP